MSARLMVVTMSRRALELLDGAPGAIPTRDLPLRRRTLYAAELREHGVINLGH